MSTTEKPDFKLRIDAHALVQLGEQLITDDEQALLELVKNSYDADADWAKIRIVSDYVPKKEDHAQSEAVGLIEIEDNGTGMDQHAIERGWLLISLSLKREQKAQFKRTPKHGRLPLGDKGLGRLGTMKLGKCLSVETRHSAKKDGWLVTFQWSDIRSGTPLDEVPITWKRVPANGQTGTTVRIFGLRDVAGWEKTKREKRLEAKLSGLISPFDLANTFEVSILFNDRELDLTRISTRLRQTATITFDYDWNGARLLITSKLKLIWFRKKTEGYDQFVAHDGGKRLLGQLSQNGPLAKEFNLSRAEEPSWFITLRKEVSAEDLLLGEHDAIDPGPFSGSLDFFDLDNDIEVPKRIFGNASDYRAIVKELAQMYVYRDGFGIRMPNDWLKLGAAWTSQTGFYSLKPNNVIGYFRISVERNDGLVEKSDREGFTENSAWRGFFFIASTITKSANRALNRLGKFSAQFLREVSGVHATEEDSSVRYGELLERLDGLLTTSDDVKRHLESHSKSRLQGLHKVEGASRMLFLDRKEPESNRQKAKQLLDVVDRLLEEFTADTVVIKKLTTELSEQRQLPAIIRRRIDEFEERTQVLYEMVAVGLSAQALAHDVPALLHQMEAHAKALSKFCKARDLERDKIIESAENIRTSIDAVRQMVDFVQPMLRGRRITRRRAKVSEFLRSFYELRGARLLTHGINWHVESEDIKDFAISFNPGRFTQVIDNLTTNSEYWLDHHFGAGTKKGRISLEIHDPELVFFDNGMGVRPDLEDSLFEAFTSGKEHDEGNGLGLFITKQLLLRDNCSIALDNVRNKHGRRYRFIINFSGVKA